MDLDPAEENPMWAPRAALAASPYASHRGHAPRDDARACRLALTSEEACALFDGEISADCVTQVVTWDAPLALLADDRGLADRLEAAGVRVPLLGGAYAERQWDAREALEEAAHRYYDHGESWGVRGMATRQPHFMGAVVEGAPHVQLLLEALMNRSTGSGIVLDARDPADLRVFGVESLDHDRVVVVWVDRVAECRRHAAVACVLHQVVPEV